MIRLLVLLVVLWTSPVCAARKTSAEQPIVVRLEAFQPTSIAFPEPVGSVTVGLPEDRLKFKQDGPYLYLMSGDPTIAGRLFVVGESGKQYTVRFSIGTPADDVLYVTIPAAHPGSALPPPFSVASMLRALRAGSDVPGQQAVDIPAPALPDTRVTITQSPARTVGGLVGMILTLTNTHATALAIDIRLGMPSGVTGGETLLLSGWTWPPRWTIKALAAETEVLAPDASTRVFVVLERRP